MTEEAVLDVSPLVHPQSLQALMNLAYKKKGALSNLRVSRTFVDSLLHESPDDGDIVKQIRRYFGISPEEGALNRIRELLRRGAFQSQVMPYRSEGTERLQELRTRLREGVPEQDAWAAEIMLEEW